MNPPTLTSCAALAVALLAPAAASAVTVVHFDDAVPQSPGKMQVGGGAAGGDRLFAGFGLFRIGVLDDVDAFARAGAFSGLVEDSVGFEVGGGARFRFLRASDTGVVDVAAAGGVSLAKSEGVLALGVDPQLVASRPFRIDADRDVVVAAALGVALTTYAIDGQDTDVDSGFLGAATVGVDVIKDLRLHLEGRLNDEITRFGVGLTWQL